MPAWCWSCRWPSTSCSSTSTTSCRRDGLDERRIEEHARDLIADLPSRRSPRTAWRPSRAATSKRCSWRACCRATRGWSSCRSRRAAWTSVPPSTCDGQLLARRAGGRRDPAGVRRPRRAAGAVRPARSCSTKGVSWGDERRGRGPRAAGPAHGGSGRGGLMAARASRRRGAPRSAVCSGVRVGARCHRSPSVITPAHHLGAHS